ncbi:MAG: NAD(P)-dependent glycerol-3-phosphate dehydrogenase [Alphaproteobacteria bacterium]|nr:NAD(P)-dependent glycerol-3-phosphate dehydrogenase [Alphaproteobacteria bacterium]
MTKIGIIGAGAWGTALAQVLAQAGRDVVLWAREPDVAAAINERHENPRFLDSIPLAPSIRATDSLSQTAGCDFLLLVTPAQYVRPTLSAIKGEIASGKPVVICAKGIELKTGLLMSQVAEDEAPGATYAILSGPTFAADIARGMPSAVTLSANDRDVLQEIREGIACRTLRPYITDDVIGAQIGGAVKNVVAIACGIVTGAGLGESARAALMTRGLAEMSRLATAMGAKKETLMGMCGVGDLVLTCTSPQSRNYSFGIEMGQGKTTTAILSDRQGVTEGVHTAVALMTMAKQHAVDMPICCSVYECVEQGVPVQTVIDNLLDRPLRSN